MINHYDLLRNWLRTLPGGFFGSTPAECFEKAYAASGLEIAMVDFRAILARHGFKPDQRGAKFVLALPSKLTGGADWEKIRRMTDVAG